jgi:hypothetical protein
MKSLFAAALAAACILTSNVSFARDFAHSAGRVLIPAQAAHHNEMMSPAVTE